MLIRDLVKSCLLAKRIGTATFLCIPIVNQFLNNSFVKRIGTAAFGIMGSRSDLVHISFGSRSLPR